MSRWIEKIQKKHIFMAIGVTFIVAIMLFAQWLSKLDALIDSQLQQKRFSPPLEFYSAPLKFFKGLKVQSGEIIESLKTSNYRERVGGQQLLEHDYFVLDADQCKTKIPQIQEALDRCIVINKSDGTHLIAIAADSTIIDVFDYNTNEPITVTELDPVLFAQFYGKEPIMRTRVELGDTPPICLNALLAIEDNKFLEHQGISWIGIFRAAMRNLVKGRLAQGGSTLTQQLVKNYFLTNEKKFSRKFKEVFMALLLETKASKDDILEAYINEIYMGQNGSFQVRGFGAASEYYFGKNLTDLNLPECALMAALVNSPGLFNPFKNQKNALDRRKKVLGKLLEEKIISDKEFQEADNFPLPIESKKILSEPAPYFVDAVMKQLDDMGVDTSQGLKVETTLNLRAQEAAQKAVAQGVDEIEKSYKKLVALQKQGKHLEGFLVSADPTNGQIQAIVGGRSYRMTQYNRAVQAKRQVGSIIKPFVYLAALQAQDDAGKNYQPLSLLNDEKFSVKYDGQEWKPNNYDNEYFGQIPMYFALKSSLNCATASLAMKVGLQNVIDLAHKAGIVSALKPFPAMTLGVFELSAAEVLQAYSTLARMGEKVNLYMIRKIKTLNDVVLYENVIQREQVLDPQNTAVLVGMLKQTVLNGSAAGVTASGFTLPAAGKTGTTNDYRDSWFAGFTPLHVAVTWIGYDDNTPSGLTGASGAVPLWIRYMKEYAGNFPPIDFAWPEGVEKRELSVEDQTALGVPNREKRPLTPIELVFKKD
jgi:penicillin-binding protein 1B